MEAKMKFYLLEQTIAFKSCFMQTWFYISTHWNFILREALNFGKVKTPNLGFDFFFFLMELQAFRNVIEFFYDNAI